MTPGPPRNGWLGAASRAAGSAWVVTAVLIGVLVAIRWPVAAGLAGDVPSDLGDPLFVTWAVTRASVHWTELLGGDLSAVTRFWDARIFYPEPLTAAYSDHFTAHALLTLPLWWLTHNALLCYNVLFLGSTVLCGLGMYVLVRDLTCDPPAAVVAALCFACAPYHATSASHLQVLSAQWMPLALFALRRYVATGGWLALAGAMLAIWLQNLSSGYYMLFFAPVAAWWSACWLTVERRWRDARMLTSLVVAGALTLLFTLPFAWPYLEVQRQFGGNGRSVDEVATYSADLAAWATAHATLTFWSWLQAYPRLEGELFMGFGMPVLAAVGTVAALRRDAASGQRAAALFAVTAAVFAVWMALGPRPAAWGQALPVPSLFAVAYEHVPGFNVARVPARFQMIVVLAGAILAGLGAFALRRRPAAVAILAAVVVLDGTTVPFPVNRVWAPTLEAQPPPGRVTPMTPPLVYGYLATLSREAVVVHFPFGAPEHDVRYMFYSATHRTAMVNGYSGLFPPSWQAGLATLAFPMRDASATLRLLASRRVTHAVVHDDVWRDGTGAELRAMLAARGARLVFTDGPDAVFQLPPQ